MNREQIYSALYALLEEVQGVRTFSRILAHESDVPPSQQPALYMTVVSQQAERKPNMPSNHLLKAKLWIYAHRDTNNVVPSAQINNIIDSIFSKLIPNQLPDYRQTLGGLVERVWVDGEIQTDEGTLGNQSIAIVPISILATDY